jgi:two-component system response regulator YesN
MVFSVLIADDEPLERAALHELMDQLEDQSIVVHEAHNGTEALKIYERESIDLAFLDIRMPGRSGLDVAEEIRRRNDSVPIVFVTAFDYFEYARNAIRIHAEDYLVKPVEDDAVQRILVRVIERRRAQRSVTDLSDVATGRFGEVVRFLEQEILDDIIAGDIDRRDLAPAFELLGHAHVCGVVVLVKPDLSRYPFRLESEAQRRTVVQRALRTAERELVDRDSRCLRRVHGDVGYLFLLETESDGESGLSARVVEDVRFAVENRMSLPVAIVATPRFDGIPHMSRAIGDARMHMQRSVDDAAQVGPAPSLVVGASDPVDRAERYMLQALVRGDIKEMEVQSNVLWQALASRDATVDVAVLRESLNRSLGFLLRSARNRGLSASPEASVLLEENHTTRQDLRMAFLERTKELVLPDRSSSGSLFSQRVMQFLQENYRRDISLGDLSSYLGISESHCSREITRHFGRSFRRMLRETRLQVARRLLADPSLVIQDVAEFSGFQDPNYFSRVFKELYGMSPRVYRNTVSA